jgi:hypothetical protein
VGTIMNTFLDITNFELSTSSKSLELRFLCTFQNQNEGIQIAKAYIS